MWYSVLVDKMVEYTKYIVAVFGVFAFTLFAINIAHAVDPAECAQMGGVVEGSVCVPTAAKTGLSDKPIPQIVVAVAEWLFGIFGAIAIITFVICGFQYVLAVGDDAQAEGAKRCMKWAVVGIALTGMALTIVGLIAKILAGNAP